MSQNNLSGYIATLFAQTCHSGKMDAQRLLNLGHLLMQVESVPGDVAEFGCHKGETALFLRSLTSKKLWLYDSFKGLPPRGEHDIAAAEFTEGYFKCSKQECEQRFAGVPPESRPQIIESWFNKLKPFQLPKRIAFAHIDCDFYGSVKSALDLVCYRLMPGAICVIDDYSWPGLPGVKLAVDVFMKDRKEKLIHPRLLGFPQHGAHQAWFVKE